jgi:hypothetical protein
MSGTTTGRRLAGIASITIDGDAYDVVSDLVWNPSSVVRETLKGQTRVEGFSEMPTQGFIACTLRDNGTLSVATFNTLVGSTLVVQQANGKTIYGDGMWCTELGEVRTQEGTYAVRFEGDNVTEGVAA